jgi:peptidoglycan-N-acetylglucosamine deacetylase
MKSNYALVILFVAVIVAITIVNFSRNQSASSVTPVSTSTPNRNIEEPENSQPNPPITSNPTPTPNPSPTPPPVTQPQGSAEVFRKIPTSQKIVVLTFDAGADKGFTSNILDTLKREGVLASFGMTGKWAEQNPELVKRIAREGHDFINHTYTHSSFTGFSTNTEPQTKAARLQELSRTETIIKNLTGMTSLPYFRPPFGDYDASVNRDIYAGGYKFNIMWTVDSLGWKGLTAEQIRKRVVDGTVPGAIHLFHVGEQSQDAVALANIISDLKEKDYSFARISDQIR